MRGEGRRHKMNEVKRMNEDVQQVLAVYLFTGELHTSTTMRIPGIHPGGLWTTLCNVPLDKATLGQVSRKFREASREWRRREMEKMVGVMLNEALDHAFDLCDRDCYPAKGGPPAFSYVEHALCLQRHELVAVKFRRTGVQRKHELVSWMTGEDWNGASFLSDEWTTKTPTVGWKKTAQLEDDELEEWREWMRCERRALHWWFKETAEVLLDPESTAAADVSDLL